MCKVFLSFQLSIILLIIFFYLSFLLTLILSFFHFYQYFHFILSFIIHPPLFQFHSIGKSPLPFLIFSPPTPSSSIFHFCPSFWHSSISSFRFFLFPILCSIPAPYLSLFLSHLLSSFFFIPTHIFFFFFTYFSFSSFSFRHSSLFFSFYLHSHPSSPILLF